jgi:hypothetical protein
MLRLAWHNLRGQGTSGALAALGMALVVGGLVATASVVYVVDRNLRAAVNASGAVMTVQLPAEQGGDGAGGGHRSGGVELPAHVQAFPAHLVAELEHQASVVEAFGVLEAWVYRGPEGQEPLVVAGVDPGRGGAELRMPRATGNSSGERAPLVQGRYLSPTAPYEAVVSASYAQQRGLEVGAVLPLGPQVECRIVGLMDPAVIERLAGVQAVIPLATAQRLVGRGPVVDAVLVTLGRLGDSEEVSRQVRTLLGPQVRISVESILDASTLALASGIRRALRAVAVFVWCFALLALLTGGVCAVLQEGSGLEALRISGWSPWRIGVFYGGRSLLEGLLAGVLGCTVGGIVAWAFGHYVGLSLPSALSAGPASSGAAPPLWVPIPATPPALVVAVALTSAAGMVPLGSMLAVAELVRRRFGWATSR